MPHHMACALTLSSTATDAVGRIAIADVRTRVLCGGMKKKNNNISDTRKHGQAPAARMLGLGLAPFKTSRIDRPKFVYRKETPGVVASAPRHAAGTPRALGQICLAHVTSVDFKVEGKVGGRITMICEATKRCRAFPAPATAQGLAWFGIRRIRIPGYAVCCY